jgi:hypothetical protein
VATTKKNTLIREFGRANLVNAVGFAKNHDKGCIRLDNLSNILAFWVNRLNVLQRFALKPKPVRLRPTGAQPYGCNID